MKLSDIGRYYKSSQGIYLSDSGGRRVVDKMADLSLNRQHAIWSGTDRPEFTDFDGAKVCVEAERTNLFLNSDSLSTQAVTVSAEAYTVSMEGTGTITFSGAHTGTLEGVEGERVSTTFTPSAGSVTCTVSGTVTNAQFEAGSYPTLYIPTSASTVTRLAPKVTIEDALPETGTVAFVVDAVRTVGVNQYFFDTAGDTSTQRSRFFIGTVNSLHCFAFGSSGGVINVSFPFSIPNNQRFLMNAAMSWDADNLNVYVEHEGQGHLYQASHQINNTSLKKVFLGSFGSGPDWGSMRFLIPWAKTDQVLTTEEEFEQLFEVIS